MVQFLQILKQFYAVAQKAGKGVYRLYPFLVLIGSGIYLSDGGEQFLALVYIFSAIGLVVILFHVGRKAMFPYLVLEQAVKRAVSGSTGAGLVVLAILILLAAMVLSAALVLA